MVGGMADWTPLSLTLGAGRCTVWVVAGFWFRFGFFFFLFGEGVVPCFRVILPASALLGAASCLSPSESCSHEDSPVSRDLSTRQGETLQKREEKINIL